MAPTSLLYRPGEAPSVASSPTAVMSPATWADLRLDELAGRLDTLGAGPDAVDLLRTPLRDPDAVDWRHEAFRDIETPEISAVVRAFAASMTGVRRDVRRAGAVRHPVERDRWRLAAMASYGAAVATLEEGLTAAEPASRALDGVRAWLREYVASDTFVALRAEVATAVAGLAAVTYRLRIAEHRILVGPVADEPDYGAEVRATFARFRMPGTTMPAADAFATLDMNPIEAAILDRVVRLHPGPFEALAACVASRASFVEPAIEAFDREVRWFLAWLDLVAPLRAVGLAVCYPEISSEGGLLARACFDLALALGADGSLVTSDVEIAPRERVLIVTGPNRGGKTTFARALGQLHHLASIGCPVPAAEAWLPLAEAVHTHFDRPESLSDPGGRLATDLRHVGAILDVATRDSLVVLNDTFASTPVADALRLSRAVIGELRELGSRCVVVTFLDELTTTTGETTVSLTTRADAGDPTRPTFRFERRPADGLAHALAVAERHGLDHDAVRAQITR
jgi:DNA mismatch repair protein MutS